MALKKKKDTKSKKAQEDGEVAFDISKSFTVDEVKDEDFDLDLSNVQWEGRKGQAGTRKKGE